MRECYVLGWSFSGPLALMLAAASRDELVPGHNIDEILRLRSSVKVVTIAGSHLAMFTNPRAAARAITAFLEEQAA